MHESVPRPLLCDRTREWVALRLDAELSDFETALMSAHLERCAGCRAFGAEIAAITEAVRAAPLELPGQSVGLPLPRRLPARRLQLVAAAAVVLVAAGLGGLLGTLRSDAPDAAASAQIHSPMLASAPDAMLRDLRVISLRHSALKSLGATKPVLRASA